MAKKVQLQTNGKEWQVIDGEQVLVDVEKQDIDPITSSSCVQIEGFRTLEEAVSDNKMLSQDLTYTKVMDKVGGDYHQNVLDGQYSKAILYGNTQVNLCEEDTSNVLQIPTTFTSFNNGELQIDNKENEVVTPLIKGVTMVNLAQTSSASLASSESVTIENIKGNTLYTLSFKFTTKNTNSGITIESYNGDTYLEDAIHKTGLGDVAKFTFTTHTNATAIKVINNAAYGGQTIKLDEIMLIEGDQTALDIPFFKGMKSVELVRPLTNLFTNDLVPEINSATVTNSDGTVTVTSTNISQWASARYHLDLKPNTKYVIMWDSLTFTQTAGGIDYIISVCENHTIFSHMGNKFTTLRSIIFDTGDKSTINIRIHATTSNSETATTTVKGLRVFEYDDYLRSVDLQSIGWFSGTKNVAVEPIKTCSKNLYPYGDINFTSEFAESWCDAKGNAYMTGDIALKSKSRFLLKKGTYCYSHGATSNVSGLQIVDDKENLLVNPIILTQDTYCTVRVKTINANTLTTVSNIQIERGETATDYVAHDSRYYEPNGQNAIVLRSLPNGVCDTFNLQTGEYVQNIREVVLNGNNNQAWQIDGTNSETNISGFYMANSNVVGFNISSTQYVICDKFKTIPSTKWKNRNTEGCIDNTGNIAFLISNSKLSEISGDGFKQYLQQNPITVQYQLDTPVTTIIPRTVKRNNNGAISTIDFGTYTNKESLVVPKNPSYLTINSMTSIKPVVEPITYIDFKTRLKANTDYSVIIDKDSTDKTINLGGTSKTYADKMLVRTPSINLEQNLRISGNGSIQNIMIIEGDVLDKELPYFNGMCNVKMPIVRNCGKNLFDGKIENGEISSFGDKYGDDKNRHRSVNYISVKPNTQYIFSSNIGETGCNWVWYDKDKKFITRTYLETDTSPSNAYYLRYLSGIPETTDITKLRVQIEEGSVVTPYEPYRGNDICIAQGEIGLSQDMFEQGNIIYNSANTGATYDSMKEASNARIRMKELIKIKPNTKYVLNFNGGYKVVVREFDENKGKLNNSAFNLIEFQSRTVFTTNANAKYISLLIGNLSNTTLPLSDFNKLNLLLIEEDNMIALRSLPNGVKDELNLLTGEYIQRVGEVVLDGSVDENIGIFTTKDEPVKTSAFYFLSDSLGTNNNAYSQTYISNSLNFNDVYTTDLECFNIHENRIRFRFLKEKATTIDECRTYLASNPITVQYQLAEPIISYPRIVSNTQEREVGVKLPNGVCDTYNPSTGITVKRVGKVVLDGSENWSIDVGYTPTANLIRMSIKQPDKKLQYNNGDLVCDKLPVVQQGVVPCIYDRWNEYLYVDVKSSDIGVTFGTDNDATIISKFKTWLNANPLTVYYELKNPIVTTDIVLPNGVHDEYNPLTGLYTKRVEYIELDGGQTNLNYRVHTNGYLLVDITDIKKTSLQTQPTNNILSNMSVRSTDDVYNNTNITTTSIALHHQAKCLMVRAINGSTTVTTIDEYTQYLSQNPIKVWYELETPITYQLTPYFGLPMPYAYKDGYLIMDSAYEGQTLPPEITYQLTVNRTGQITQNNIKLKEHTARLSNLEYILIEATLESIFSREMQKFELELMNVELPSLDE